MKGRRWRLDVRGWGVGGGEWSFDGEGRKLGGGRCICVVGDVEWRCGGGTGVCVAGGDCGWGVGVGGDVCYVLCGDVVGEWVDVGDFVCK